MTDVDALLSDLARLDIQLWEESGRLRFRAPPALLSAELRERILGQRDSLLTRLRNKESARAPATTGLPLTDLQRAYWFAEQDSSEPTAGYWYEEYTARELDRARFERCLTRLSERHDALRMTVTSEGRQEILAPRPFPVAYEDLRGLSAESLETHLTRTRREWRSPRGSLAAWPLINLLVQQTEDAFHLHVGGRFIVIDGVAWDQLCQELALLYRDPDAVLPELSRSYAAAVLEEQVATGDRARALGWWCARDLPGPPSLPIVPQFDPRARRWFERKSQSLEQTETKALSEHCRRAGVTLNAFLLAAYAETLRRWCESHFTLTLLLSSPRHLRKGGRWPLSNAASTLLLEVDLREKRSLADRARQIQARLAEDLARSSANGIAVTRERARRKGAPAVPNPFVFASTVGMDVDEDGRFGLERLGFRSVQNYLQTPDVLLDHQVYGTNGRLLVNWDYVAAAFEPFVVDSMFAAYWDVVRAATRAATWETPVTPKVVAARPLARDTRTARAGGRLHDFVERKIATEEIALRDEVGSLGTRELISRAWGVAKRLRDAGLSPERPVPVLARRRRDQLIGALGVLFAGGAYLPVDPDAPPLRLERILAVAAPLLALSDGSRKPPASSAARWFELGSIEPGEPGVLHGSPEDLAYVIFTSGSTGIPKGVAIQHGAARNTIDDMLSRWPIGPSDAIFAISRFTFDLSVFDSFGALAAGARIVVPEEERRLDMAHACDLISSEGVTVWNSVPALMELLVEYAEAHALELPLRLAFLSGDWIPKTLPERVRGVAPGCRVIALGGATEASIWSNYFDTSEYEPSWPSVPYGVPLSNQELYVLDDELNARPDFVPGDLFIGGAGLAREYFGDPALTEERFVTHPRTGERLYRTGDRARCWPNGLVEFLGRSDSQVKLRGHRVELGEIEAALSELPGVAAACAFVVGERERGRLCAAIVVREDAGPRLDELTASLRNRLPAHMLPSRVVQVERIPLSENGKVDRGALATSLARSVRGEVAAVSAASPLERTVIEVWAELLGRDDIGLDDDFYALGGDSLTALRMVHALQRRTGFSHLTTAQVLGAPSVRELAADLARTEGNSGGGRRGAVAVHVFSRRETAPLVAMLPPIGGSVFGYRVLADLLQADHEVIGFSAAGVLRGTPEGDVPTMARRYLELIAERAHWERRLVLVGWSFGGVVALELSGQLRARGLTVPTVVVDPWVRRSGNQFPDDDELWDDYRRSVYRRASDRPSRPSDDPGIESLFRVYATNARALLAYAPATDLARGELFVARRADRALFPTLVPIVESEEWPAARSFSTFELDADHYEVMDRPHVERVAERVRNAASERPCSR